MKITSLEQFNRVSIEDELGAKAIYEAGFNVYYWPSYGFFPIFSEDTTAKFKKQYTNDIANLINISEQELIDELKKYDVNTELIWEYYSLAFFNDILECQYFIDNFLEPLYINNKFVK